MSLAMVASRALVGITAPPVRVEVHLANGLPSFTLVGLADTEVKEARERVRAALQQSGFEFPHNRRVTVNLAPADLPKESGRFDLPIALGILAALGLVDRDKLAQCEFAGELSLAGELRPVRGALALALAVRQTGAPCTLVLPDASAIEAALVAGVDVRAATHLRQVVDALQSGDDCTELPAPAPPAAADGTPVWPDLRDIKGQAMPKRALEIAAAGGHGLLLIGPPGTGKSMLAQRLGGLLPPMTNDEALQSAAILGVASGFDPARWQHRPLRTPHHSASAVALVGGGTPPRPGEISLAHAGILFLDELPLRWRCNWLSTSRSAITKDNIFIDCNSRTYTGRRRLLGAGMAKVLLSGWRCERCAHEWVPREKDKDPTVCPSCKSPYWDKPRRGATSASSFQITASSGRSSRSEGRGRTK